MSSTTSAYGTRERVGYFIALPLFLLMLLLPAPGGLETAGWRVMGVAVLMAILWMTECIPIPVTALIPLVVFPFFSVDTFANVARSYANSNIFLFMGGFFIAIAMQKWGLHRRIALQLILLIGSSPRRIVLGFMVATALLSMWISNTATTMMLYPIGLAVILQIMAEQPAAGAEQDAAAGQFRTSLMLAIAYSASIGGITTLVGTPPNIVFVSAYGSLFPEAPEIGFLNWAIVGSVLLVIFLPICWLILTRFAFHVDNDPLPGGKDPIRSELFALGPMKRQERIVAIVFVLTALAWMTRKDIALGDFTITGWASLFGVAGTVHDATVAMLAALVLFVVPSSLKKGEFLLDWESAVKIPWGILILFGGGIALADGFRSSGLAIWIGEQLSLFAEVPQLVMIMLTSTTMTFTTELTSNIATTTLFMPILASTATAIGTHPLMLMIPATISASCAFMLPVATPPNAIIFASGYVTIPQMARAGILLNLIGIVLVTLVTYLIVVPLFGLG